MGFLEYDAICGKERNAKECMGTNFWGNSFDGKSHILSLKRQCFPLKQNKNKNKSKNKKKQVGQESAMEREKKRDRKSK